MAPSPDQKRSFKFVFVPAELSEPLAEWQLAYTQKTEVDCLFARLKVGREGLSLLEQPLTLSAPLQEHFRKAKPAKTADQLQAYRQQLLANVPEEQRKALTDDVMALATDLNMACALLAALACLPPIAH